VRKDCAANNGEKFVCGAFGPAAAQSVSIGDPRFAMERNYVAEVARDAGHAACVIDKIAAGAKRDDGAASSVMLFSSLLSQRRSVLLDDQRCINSPVN
jgi:hypothetical protein